MKKFLALLFCAFFALALTAQERSGNITGMVVDTEGNPLPGVNLTLSGTMISPMPTQTNAEGKFRFLSLFPSNEYAIKAELQGFKTKTQTGIIVNIGRSSDIVISMEQGGLEEQITVIAQTPIVEAKKSQITHTVTYDMLQSLPSARDPWVILQMTPAIQLDRENIGGVESGQQSSYTAKGSSTQEWTVDGMQTTDRNSGGSPGYYDFDSFEEMNISTGTLDVEHRDPGIVVNIVTRRGSNKLSLGGRFYWMDEKFQKVVPQATIDEFGVAGYNHAVDIKDFGFNAGGPLVKDKAWWWMSYGVNQIKTLNLYETRDDTYLNNYNGKINLQIIPQNRFELLYMIGDKTKFGRSSSASVPLGWNQGSKFHFGNPTWKLQDEHMFGDNLLVSLRLGKSNAGFGMTPVMDLDLNNYTLYDVEADLYYNSQTYFYSDRPHPYGVLQAQYFNDNLFGAAHEIKVGFEVNNNSRNYIGGYPGNIRVYQKYYYDTIDWNGAGGIDTPYYDFDTDVQRIWNYRNDVVWNDGTNRLAAYFNDTISFGRFNINIGLRMDRSKGYIEENLERGLFLTEDSVPDSHLEHYADIALQLYDTETIGLIRNLLPERDVPRIDPIKVHNFFSPRLGVNYDIFGDGKTIFKLAYSMYPGNDIGLAYTTPYGRYGNVNFWWGDGYGYGANDGSGVDGIRGNLDDTGADLADGVATWDELYWASYATTARTVYHAFDVNQNFVGQPGRDTGMWAGQSWQVNGDGYYEDMGLTDSIAYLNPNWKTTQTHELSVSLDREIMRNFGVSLDATYKQVGRFSWNPAYYPGDRIDEFGYLWNTGGVTLDPADYDHIRSSADYEAGGVIPDMLYSRGPDGIYGNADDIAYDPKEAAGRTWYVLKNQAYTRSTPAYYTTAMDPARKNKYWGIDLVFNKRLANKWMMNGSVTYQMQKAYYGTSYTDPTNQWAIEGQTYGVTMGGTSGKINQEYFTRWMVKWMGLYQLPGDFNISGTISGHEGTIPAETFGVRNSTLPNSYSYTNTLNTTVYSNRARLPNVWVFNFKLEKMLRLSDTGRMYFSVDMFNAFNNLIVLRRYNANYGTWRFTGSPSTIPNTLYNTGTVGSTQPWTRPSSTQNTNNELMNPLCFRLGLRFQL